MFCFIVVQVFSNHSLPVQLIYLFPVDLLNVCVCVILFEIVVITVCWKQLISAERKENVVSFDRRLVFQLVVKNTLNILWNAENILFNCSYFKCWILFTYFLFMFFPHPNYFYLLHVTWNWLLSFSFISCMFCCHILFVFQKKN